MAFHDWNHDGEKDWKDNPIEYQLLKNMNKDKNEKPQYTPPRNGNGMSGCCAFVITVLSIIIAAAIIGFIFGGDISNAPDWLVALLFIIIVSVVSALLSLRG